MSTTIVARRPTRSVLFNAADFLELSVTDAQSLPLTWRYDGKRIEITYSRDLAAGESRTLVTSYVVWRPVGGLHFNVPDSEYPERPLFAATDNEPERARYWLPCIDQPQVRPRATIRIRHDADLLCLASGEFKHEEACGEGLVLSEFELEYRCPSYLLAFAVGEFGTVEDAAFKEMPITYYSTQDHTSHLQQTFGSTPHALAWLEKRLGRSFPAWPKYASLCLPELPHHDSGHESTSLAIFNERFLLDDSIATEMREVVDATVVRKMAQAYFGNSVVCRHWDHGWLRSSFGAYLEVRHNTFKP